MEFSICRVNQSDLDELTAVEAVCFHKEEAATREAFAARLADGIAESDMESFRRTLARFGQNLEGILQHGL